MSWQSKVLGLVKKYGEGAKFAAKTILSAAIPGSPVVIALVESAFETAQKTAQDDWEINLSKQVQTTADNQARMEQMLDILSTDLQSLVSSVAPFKGMPEAAATIIESAKRNNTEFQKAVNSLNGIARRFDNLDDLMKKLHDKIDNLTAAFDRFAGSPAAEAVARENQMPVTDVSLTISRCVVDVAQKALLLDATAVVRGEKSTPIAYRTVYFFLNGQPLKSVTTDGSGEACLRDPIPLYTNNLQRKNLLQARVDSSAKSASVEVEILRPIQVKVVYFNPIEDYELEPMDPLTFVKVSAVFSGTIEIKIHPGDFLDIHSVVCQCRLNDLLLGEGSPDNSGQLCVEFRKEYREMLSRDKALSRDPMNYVQYPFSWSRTGKRKLKVKVPGLPDWCSFETDLNPR